MSDKLWRPTLRLATLAVAIVVLAAWLAGSVYNRLLAGHEQRYIELTYQGPLQLMEQQLLHPSPGDAPLAQRLQQLQRTLGAVQLKLLPLEQFTPAEQQRLRRGEIVYADVGYAEPDHVYHQLGQTGWIMGLRMPDMPPLLGVFIVCGLLFALLAGGGLYCLVVRPYWRDIQTLQQAVEALGQGQLATRIDALSPASTLYPLAARMNLLASRVGELVMAQRDLLHAVAHELRTPLARMFFQLERLSGQAPAAPLAAVEANVQQMRQLIEHVLHYASLDVCEAGQGCQQIDVEELRSWLVDFPELHDELPANLTVWADPALLPYALRNLVANAMRHARKQVWLSVAVRDDAVLLAVEDDGPGVPEGDRERIFAPLVHLGRGTGGAGMGLPITRRIAQLHGGQVSVATGARAGGACFTLALPPTPKT